ncbi:MAG: hypothetical protein JWL83_2317 [Actinomycetia bacterium]|nr:hypothetical protein [Actinomycetes bacterium]
MEVVGWVAVAVVVLVALVAFALLFRSWSDLTRYRRIRKM